MSLYYWNIYNQCDSKATNGQCCYVVSVQDNTSSESRLMCIRSLPLLIASVFVLVHVAYVIIVSKVPCQRVRHTYFHRSHFPDFNIIIFLTSLYFVM